MRDIEFGDEMCCKKCEDEDINCDYYSYVEFFICIMRVGEVGDYVWGRWGGVWI